MTLPRPGSLAPLTAAALLSTALAACHGGSGKDDTSPPADSQAETGDSGESAADDSGGDSGTGDSVETADSGETSETADTGDTGDTGGDPPPAGLGLPDLSGMNLVYVNVDTLRADHLPEYGYARETLPLTGDLPWTIVHGLYADSSWTMPSTASLLTASPPDVHGLTDDGGSPGSKYLLLSVPTVVPTFEGAGFATALMSGNPWVTDLTDIAFDFDTMTHVPKELGTYNLAATADAGLAWIDGLPADQPFFLFLQPMDMHLPYQAAEPELGTFGTTTPPWSMVCDDEDAQIRQIQHALAKDPAGATAALIDVYDETILGVDLGLARLIDGLSERGLLDSTVVIFSADHGETLNDDGSLALGHGRSVREELVHAPLYVLYPGSVRQDVTCVAPNEDIFPTLLDAWGLPPMKEASGQSLQDACPGIAVSALWLMPDELTYLAASDGEQKVRLSCDGTGEVGYDLLADPHELTPVAPDTLSHGAALQAAIVDTMARITAEYPDLVCPM